VLSTWLNSIAISRSWGSLCSIFFARRCRRQIVKGLLDPLMTLPSFSGATKLQATLVIGLAAESHDRCRPGRTL
jgi:hypothetical protein